jgi:hypothetical protein
MATVLGDKVDREGVLRFRVRCLRTSLKEAQRALDLGGYYRFEIEQVAVRLNELIKVAEGELTLARERGDDDPDPDWTLEDLERQRTERRKWASD